MGRDLTREERDAIETLIDSAGLSAVLRGLSEVCEEKAEHIRALYGLESRQLSRAWHNAAGTIGVASRDEYVTRIGEP